MKLLNWSEITVARITIVSSILTVGIFAGIVQAMNERVERIATATKEIRDAQDNFVTNDVAIRMTDTMLELSKNVSTLNGSFDTLLKLQMKNK